MNKSILVLNTLDGPSAVVIKHTCAYDELKSALSQVIYSFMETDEGYHVADEMNGGVFNWGDALIHIPASFWETYDIWIKDYPNVISVDEEDNFA
jgi:hypothetical protein